MEKFMACARKETPLRDIYSLSAVKAHTDEVLKEYLVFVRNYRESLKAVNTRLAFGAVNILLCAALLYLSTCFEFVAYKPYAAVIVTLFWLLANLEGCLTWLLFGYTFIGRDAKQNELRVTTKLDPPSTEYTVLFYFGKKEIPSKVSAPITALYTSRHTLDYKAFADLISEGFQGEL